MSIGNANAYGDSHANAYGDSYLNPHCYADSHADGYFHSNTYGDSDSYADAHSDCDTYPNIHCYADGHADCDSYRYACPNHTYCARALDTRATCSGSVLDRRDFESGRHLPQRRVNRYHQE